MPNKNFLQTLLPHRDMHFAPVEADDDELTHAIESDTEVQDDHWELQEPVDGGKLEAFWSTAVDEARHEEIKNSL